MPEPFRVSVPDAVLADLHDRLGVARLPGAIAGAGWDQGTSLDYLRELLAYWREEFSWRRQEDRLNQLDHFTEDIDGQRIHFVYQRSGQPGALPVLLAHGWPGSIVEFLDVVGPLTAPGAGELPFDLIIPSLPGYGFSARLPSRAGTRAASRQPSRRCSGGSASSGTACRAATGARSWPPTWPTWRPTGSPGCT